MLLHLAYPYILYGLGSLLVVLVMVKMYLVRRTWYQYPVTGHIAVHGKVSSPWISRSLHALRIGALGLLAFLAARPQWADERSQISINGIDIVLALDVSGSMEFFDDPHDRRPRIEVAKAEAIRFIEKRTSDPIGLVIFAKDALSRCPLTLDKAILKELVGNLNFKIIDPQGTALGTGLATAINRLKNSQAKSKIVVLLTDGAPTPGEKISPDAAIELAVEYGIKVYTIGIGNEQGGYFMHPIFGLQSGQSQVNSTLLKTIAEKTGGAFFLAHNPKEMRSVYDTIDTLEKTTMQTNIFHTLYEAFAEFIWFFIALFFLELFLRLTIWRGLL
jgi:Ca-activated chloride channel family protein